MSTDETPEVPAEKPEKPMHTHRKRPINPHDPVAKRMLGPIWYQFSRLWFPLRWLGYLMMLIFWQPSAAQQLHSMIRATKTRKLRAIGGTEAQVFWPTAIWGFALSYFASFGFVPEVLLVWIWLALFFHAFITALTDYGLGKWILGASAIVIVLVALGWYASAYQVSYLGIFASFLNLFHNDIFPHEIIRTISAFFVLVYMASWFGMNTQRVLKIAGNYVSVWTLGVKELSDRASGFSLNPSTTDVNEYAYGLSRMDLRGRSSKVKSHSWSQMPLGNLVYEVAIVLLSEVEVRSDGDIDIEDDHHEEDLD